MKGKMSVKALRKLFFPGLMILLALPGYGQNVEQQGKNRFMIDNLSASCKIASEKVILINSAINLSGSLKIAASDGNSAVFKYKELMKAPTESDAIEYARVIEVTLEETTSGGRLILQAPNPAPWSGTDNSGVIDGELLLPKNCKIEIEAEYFDIKIKGPFRSVENKSSFGRWDIIDIQEVVNVTTINRNINASNISGDISLATSHADIAISNLTTSGNPAYIRNENGNINAENISGVFDIKNSFGRIRLSNLRLVSDQSRISASYSPISLEISGINDGGLTVRNTNEDIKVTIPESLPAEFSLRVDTNGEIDVEGLKVKPLLVESDRLDFITGSGGNRFRMSVRGEGNISVRSY